MNRHRAPSNAVRLTLGAAVAIATLMLAPMAARSQCAITGPTGFCGSPVLLCGPDGGSSYSWTLPSGATRSGQCVLASTAGNYRLTYVDALTGQTVGPCLHTLGNGSAVASISGPTRGCGGQPVELCGPSGELEYDWLGPNDFTANTACVSATEAGSYMLWVRPAAGGCWSEAAEHVIEDFGGVAGPAPAVSGETEGCTGRGLELCGPAGAIGYAWTGPNGFAANTACASVNEAGTYELRVRADAASCWSDPAQHAVTFSTCTRSTNCPMPAWWWERQCRPSRRIPEAQLDAVAKCVVEHDSELDASFCETMKTGRLTLRQRAQRQVAAVWANVCASNLEVISPDNDEVALDPATAVNVAGYQGTISAWLEHAANELKRLESSNSRHRGPKDAYRSLIRVGWNINHGVGIGPVCEGHRGAQAAAAQSVAGEPSLTAMSSSSLSDDPEPLAAELMDDSDAPLAFGLIEPNPFKSTMRLAYAVADLASAEVNIGVYDVSGRLVRDLVRGSQAPGNYVAVWDGRDDGGALVRGGMYFVLGRVGGERVQTRVTFVR